MKPKTFDYSAINPCNSEFQTPDFKSSSIALLIICTTDLYLFMGDNQNYPLSKAFCLQHAWILVMAMTKTIVKVGTTTYADFDTFKRVTDSF